VQRQRMQRKPMHRQRRQRQPNRFSVGTADEPPAMASAVRECAWLIRAIDDLMIRKAPRWAGRIDDLAPHGRLLRRSRCQRLTGFGAF